MSAKALERAFLTFVFAALDFGLLWFLVDYCEFDFAWTFAWITFTSISYVGVLVTDVLYIDKEKP